MTNLEQILMLILLIYISFCQNEMLFYKSMQKYCKKFKGECIKCNCWSCPRKLYIDEYLENRSKNERK